MATVNWPAELVEQLDWHWTNQLRPRLDALQDAEYFWEPVPGCWNIRPRNVPSSAPIRAGSGEFLMDDQMTEANPPPVTTIAWRMGHLIVGVLGIRTASHFGGPAMDEKSFEYAGTARTALDQLDAAYSGWMSGVRALGDEGMARPCGPAEGPFSEAPLAKLVLHISRETIHHGAEIALLRDLYAWTDPAA